MSEVEHAAARLEISQFTVRRPDGVELFTVDEANFGPGLVALTGPNGSGKSTLLKALAGLDSKSGGAVSLGNWDRLGDRRHYAANLAFQPQNFSAYPEMSGFEFLTYILRLRGMPKLQARDRAASGLAQVGLGEAAVALGAYSQGMLQRLGLAYVGQSGALLGLLDEPFAGIDPPGRATLLDWLATLVDDRILIVCTHHVDEMLARGARRFDVGDLASGSRH
ncbi:ABC transporter ATP-binding protein [Qipengyuania profunda]|jgi:ABC-2 type transport system ATP-binding protein|uniref:ABC transporter ATP-binding protein n=1 Tax=Qipengyuania profunda TaxID=3113984 RepID=UPI002A18C88B|nr:ABC transporter ATP-binding protein [Qipengyuania sp. HL-TH1]WPL57900.1 ABC transporter ATP-binding protein [Qipengyuania sp. HL-TH5]